MTLILIGDDAVKKVPVVECGDPMVDLASVFPALSFDFTRKHVQTRSETISIGRRQVGERLLEAQRMLPRGLRLLMKECYRPLWIQREFFDGYSAYLRRKFPEWDEVKVYEECSKLNAPVEVAPHSTGGAVDLTLIDQDGRWLDMGTEFNADPIETNGATYTDSNLISEEARAHRKILATVMRETGFVNYPTEWWHWSFGDKYWALMSGMPHAIFDSVEEPELQK